MTLQEQFFRASGIDLSYNEVPGETPYLKNGRWSSMERGLAWQKYALWLEQRVKMIEDAYYHFVGTDFDEKEWRKHLKNKL